MSENKNDIPIEWIIKWNEDYAPRDYREMTEDMIADWREEQAEDTTYQHRVDGLIERWRKEHEDNR